MLVSALPSAWKRGWGGREREAKLLPPNLRHCKLCHWRVFLLVFPFYFSIIWVTYAPAKYSLLAFIFHRNQYYLQYIKQSIRAWHLLSFWRKTMPAICRGITTKKGPQKFKFSLGDFFRRTRLFSVFFPPINKIQPFFFFNSLPFHLSGYPPSPIQSPSRPAAQEGRRKHRRAIDQTPSLSRAAAPAKPHQVTCCSPSGCWDP